MLVQVLHHQRGDEQLAEQHRRGDAQLAARGGVAAGGGFLRLLQLGEDAPAVFHVALAGLGDVHAAGGAGQQQGADALLQRRHGTGHTGWRHVKAARGGGEALFLGHGEKHLHLLETVHLGLLWGDAQEWGLCCVAGNRSSVTAAVLAECVGTGTVPAVLLAQVSGAGRRVCYPARPNSADMEVACALSFLTVALFPG